MMLRGLLVLTLVAARAWALTPATLTALDLQPQRVTLQSLTEQTVSYFDAQRTLRSEALSTLLRVRLDTAEASPGAATAMVTLQDGQRLTGQALPRDKEGVLHWKHPSLGELALPLEQVAGVAWGDVRLARSNEQGGDRVLLVNGDRVEGLILGLDGQSVAVQDNSGRELKLPRERVAAVQFASVVSPPPTRHLAHLSDGTRLRVTKVALSGDQVELTTPLLAQAEPVTIAMGQFRGLDVASPTHRLRPLEELTMRAEPGEVFGRAWPVLWRDGSLHAHAPATLRFDLPQGVTRFACHAQLDTPSGQAQRWASMELIIACDGKELTRQKLDADHSSLNINVQLEGFELTLELREAANGPIMDRLRLSEATLLLQTEPQ